MISAGAQYEGCNENLVFTKPDVVEDIHRAFYTAGADVVETNTFGGTPLVLAEYGLQDRALELNRTAAQIARKAADDLSTTNKPRFVAGSMGPTTKTISVTGGVTFDDLIRHFNIQAKGLIEGDVDVLLLENRARYIKSQSRFDRHSIGPTRNGHETSVMISGTIEPMGTMLAGQGVEALYASLEHMDLLSIGLNCATGPQFMTDHIRSLAEMAQCHVSCIPNAGLPDEEGRYNETPEGVASVLGLFADRHWLNIVGGCCGNDTGIHRRYRANGGGIQTTGTARRKPFSRFGNRLSAIQPRITVRH